MPGVRISAKPPSAQNEYWSHVGRYARLLSSALDVMGRAIRTSRLRLTLQISHDHASTRVEGAGFESATPGAGAQVWDKP